MINGAMFLMLHVGMKLERQHVKKICMDSIDLKSLHPNGFISSAISCHINVI